MKKLIIAVVVFLPVSNIIHSARGQLIAVTTILPKAESSSSTRSDLTDAVLSIPDEAFSTETELAPIIDTIDATTKIGNAVINPATPTKETTTINHPLPIGAYSIEEELVEDRTPGTHHESSDDGDDEDEHDNEDRFAGTDELPEIEVES
jgi:hypothetical protein